MPFPHLKPNRFRVFGNCYGENNTIETHGLRLCIQFGSDVMGLGIMDELKQTLLASRPNAGISSADESVCSIRISIVPDNMNVGFNLDGLISDHVFEC